jgi:sulfite reductase alpha subunit-like flavoprotein
MRGSFVLEAKQDSDADGEAAKRGEADFSGTGKAYTPFPDAARFRIMLNDVRDDDVRTRFVEIWTNPLNQLVSQSVIVNMTYSDTFCAAGDLWDAALSASGASRFIDVKRHDASSGTLAEDVAAEWAEDWAQTLVTA